jgi:hypothetical protein
VLALASAPTGRSGADPPLDTDLDRRRPLAPDLPICAPPRVSVAPVTRLLEWRSLLADAYVAGAEAAPNTAPERRARTTAWRDVGARHIGITGAVESASLPGGSSRAFGGAASAAPSATLYSSASHPRGDGRARAVGPGRAASS